MKNTKTLEDLLQRHEDLLPELAAYLHRDPVIGECLKHPLAFSVPHTPQLNAYLNEFFRHKRAAIEEATADKNWMKVLWLYEKPYRIQAFDEINDRMTDTEYWENLGHLWIDSENIWQNKSLWKKFLISERLSRENFMTMEDRARLVELPASFNVYRGYQKGKNFDGLSYTLDRNRAEWFAKRVATGNRAAVRTRTVKKSDVSAYLNGRGEQEIILL